MVEDVLREPGPHIGFTTPRALGKAVVRNRIRRRTREAVRLELELLNPAWSIVFNPRRKALDCTLDELRNEVRRLFLKLTRLSEGKSPAPSPVSSGVPSSSTNE